MYIVRDDLDKTVACSLCLLLFVLPILVDPPTLSVMTVISESFNLATNFTSVVSFGANVPESYIQISLSSCVCQFADTCCFTDLQAISTRVVSRTAASEVRSSISLVEYHVGGPLRSCLWTWQPTWFVLEVLDKPRINLSSKLVTQSNPQGNYFQCLYWLDISGFHCHNLTLAVVSLRSYQKGTDRYAVQLDPGI